MADYEYDIGVIGGGAAGLTVTSGVGPTRRQDHSH